MVQNSMQTLGQIWMQINKLCDHRTDDLKMTFSFLSFPQDFQMPFSIGEDVLRYRDQPMDTGPFRLVIDAMQNLQPVWAE